jgi:hypothetical protein
VLLEEHVGLIDVLRLEDPGVGFEERIPEAVTEEVSDLIAEECSNSTQSGANGSISSDFAATIRPAVNSSESPGSSGKSSPDSMNTTRSKPPNIHVPNELRRLIGSRNPGNKATSVVVWARRVSITEAKGTG